MRAVYDETIERRRIILVRDSVVVGIIVERIRLTEARLPETVVVAILATRAAGQLVIRPSIAQAVGVGIGAQEVGFTGIEFEIVIDILDVVLETVLVEVGSGPRAHTRVEDERRAQADRPCHSQLPLHRHAAPLPTRWAA